MHSRLRTEQTLLEGYASSLIRYVVSRFFLVFSVGAVSISSQRCWYWTKFLSVKQLALKFSCMLTNVHKQFRHFW
jgi:hypothetical protein